MGGASIQIVHYFGHGYLEEEKSMIQFHSYFWSKIFDRHGVPPSETFSLIKKNQLDKTTRGTRVGIPFTGFTLATFLCLSQTRT
jgi:hypothetical protein